MSSPFRKTAAGISHRQHCAKCGGHLLIGHPSMDVVDVFAATLPTLRFTPSCHVNYAEMVLPISDGLPKFRDFPREFGGWGGQIQE